jgi:hypothetical protein
VAAGAAVEAGTAVASTVSEATMGACGAADCGAEPQATSARLSAITGIERNDAIFKRTLLKALHT